MKKKVKRAFLDVIFELLTRGAIVLAVVTTFAAMYPPSPLGPLFHNPDPKAQSNMVLYFAIILAVSAVIYTIVALSIYRMIKRGMTRKDLATGQEFNEAQLRRDQMTAIDAKDRSKAVTIPSHEFDQEVAWLFNTLYPVQAQVDSTGKGKINIKLYNDKKALVGIVQASQDAEDKIIKPIMLKSLNSYKSKANLSRAFFVTTGMFDDDTLQQAKMMGITLVDGPLLDAWRKRAKVKKI